MNSRKWSLVAAGAVVIGIQAIFAEAQLQKKDAPQATKRVDLSHTDIELQFAPIPAWHIYWQGKNPTQWHDIHSDLCRWLCAKSGVADKTPVTLIDLETISVGNFVGDRYSGRGTVVSFDSKESSLLSEGSSRFFRVQSAGAPEMHIRALVRATGERGDPDASIETIRISYRFLNEQWVEASLSRESMQLR